MKTLLQRLQTADPAAFDPYFWLPSAIEGLYRSLHTEDEPAPQGERINKTGCARTEGYVCAFSERENLGPACGLGPPVSVVWTTLLILLPASIQLLHP